MICIIQNVYIIPTHCGVAYDTYSNHVTYNKWEDTLIWHTTMRRNPINFHYNSGHATLWCVEVGPVANARDGSTQEHDQARVVYESVHSLARGHVIRMWSRPNNDVKFPNMETCFMQCSKVVVASPKLESPVESTTPKWWQNQSVKWDILCDIRVCLNNFWCRWKVWWPFMKLYR